MPRPGPPVGDEPGTVVLPVPEIRDYQRINAELVQALDAGHGSVQLAGVEGQRLLVSGLRGGWKAIVEVEGDAGPELAAGLDAPGLIVVCRGRAGDGAGSGLRSGCLLLLDGVGAAVGYALRGGTIVVHGDAGPRAGLNQAGGLLVLLGGVGPLAGERQSGGRLFLGSNRAQSPTGVGHRGSGRLLARGPGAPLDLDDSTALQFAVEAVRPWLAIDPETLSSTRV